jgi:4-aminobutyrate aminotransferase-like enzyme
VRQVRGLGLMVALEFKDGNPGLASAVVQAALKHKLMLLTAVRSALIARVCVHVSRAVQCACVCIAPAGVDVCWFSVQGAFESIRFMSPLTVSEAEVNMALERLGSAFADVLGKK